RVVIVSNFFRCRDCSHLFFLSNDPATTELYTLSLHDALPIWTRGRIRAQRTRQRRLSLRAGGACRGRGCDARPPRRNGDLEYGEDRKSTRLNSSHVSISYAVFCLKKKTKKQTISETHLYS